MRIHRERDLKVPTRVTTRASSCKRVRLRESELFYPPFKLLAEKTGIVEGRDGRTFSNDIAEIYRAGPETTCFFPTNIIRARKLQRGEILITHLIISSENIFDITRAKSEFEYLRVSLSLCSLCSLSIATREK